MTDDQLDDLKQFITATVSQSEARLESHLEVQVSRLDGKVDTLRQEMHDGFAGIAEVFEQHDARIMKLELKVK